MYKGMSHITIYPGCEENSLCLTIMAHSIVWHNPHNSLTLLFIRLRHNNLSTKHPTTSLIIYHIFLPQSYYILYVFYLWPLPGSLSIMDIFLLSTMDLLLTY